ncbi:MAG: MerR family transcriptional regulator [Methylocystis sp.]
MTDQKEQGFRTIGEVAESLDLPPHVLRFWETRFKELEPLKRAGGRRYYRPRDVELVMALRHLLYGQGYTIKGVQRILKEQGARAVIENLRAGKFQPGFSPSQAAETAEAPPPPPARRVEPPDLGLEPEPAPLEVMIPREPPAQAGQDEPEPAPPPARLPALVAQPLHEASHFDEEDIRRLRLALADLAECRRLLRLTKR